MRIALVIAAFLVLVPSTAVAEPSCVVPREDGGCALLLDPTGEDPLRYDVGDAPPPTGCDEGDDCCSGCWFVVAVCTVDDGPTPYFDARGGASAPVAHVWIVTHYECFAGACWGDPVSGGECGVRYYGYSRAVSAGLRDSDGDGDGDAVQLNGIDLATLPA